MDYRTRVVPTYIENWPNALDSLSIAQVDVPLTLEEAEALGTNIVELFETFPKPHFRRIGGIRERLDGAVKKFPDGGFVRLGSRSPKDSHYGYEHGFKCLDGFHALKVLCGASERVCDDLHLALAWKYEPHLFVRQWIPMQKETEFRCFMKGRQLVGISQYHYLDGAYPFVEEHKAAINFAIHAFFPSFRTASHLDDVVFDVFLSMREHPTAQGIERIWQVKLIEINPFFEMTDPCLFSWKKGGDFDSSFRTCKATTDKTRYYDKYSEGP